MPPSPYEVKVKYEYKTCSKREDIQSDATGTTLRLLPLLPSHGRYGGKNPKNENGV